MAEDQKQKTFKRNQKIERLKLLLEKCPDCVFETMSYIEIIKSTLWADLSVNGGKLSYRMAAIKYGISLSKVRVIIKNINKIQNYKSW